MAIDISQSQIGTWWNPLTNKGYSGPRQSPNDVPADPVTGKPVTQQITGAASVPQVTVPQTTAPAAPATQAAAPAIKPPAQSARTAQATVPTTSASPTGASSQIPLDVFGTAMNEMRAKLSQNDDLMKQKALLLQQLYDNKLTPDQIKNLTPSQQTAVMSDNRNLIDMEVRLINDTVQGRADTLDKSISYITDLYSKEQTDAQTKFNDAQSNVLKFIQQFPNTQQAGMALEKLYGPDMVQQLKGMGIDIEALAGTNIETLSGQRYVPGGSGSFTVTVPTGTIASQTSNPLNIKYSDVMSQFGATDSGIAATDGGTFSSFSTPEDGLQAGIQLLKSDYGNLTVQQAMIKWSNGGYGADVTTLNPNQVISSLSDAQMQQLVTDMAMRESGATVASTAQPLDVESMKAAPSDVNQATGFTNSQLLQLGGQYALTKSMPYFGMSGSSPKVQNIRTTIAGLGADMATAAGTDLATLQAEYKANSASMSKLTVIRNATLASSTTANENLQLALDQSANVPRTGTPMVNRYAQWALQKNLTGDPDLAKFETYIYTAAREYAKVTSGSSASVAGLTDSATKAAGELLNAAQTPDQFAATVQAMQADMDNVKYGYDVALSQISSPLAQFFGADPDAATKFDSSKPVPSDLKSLKVEGPASMSNQDLLNSIPGL